VLFKEIIGNSNLKIKLINSVKNDRIAHAQLFIGNKGSANLAIAMAYAQFLNCQNRNQVDSCNECHSCLMYNTLTHPDLHLIFPVLKINNIKNPVSDNFVNEWRQLVLDNPYISISEWYENFNAGNKQGGIYKDEAELLQKKVALRNYESQYRVVFIWLPEKMNLTASNKLLKLIEEPPKGTYFIMISENTNEILPTIISRLQTIKVRPFKKEDIVEYLYIKKEISHEIGKKIAQISNGDINKALKISDTEIGDNDFLKGFQTWMQICYKNNIIELSNWNESVVKKSRENQKNFLVYALKIIRSAFLLGRKAGQTLSLTKTEKEFVINFAPFVNENNSIVIFESIEKAIFAITRNANSKIVFYELSLKMMKFLKVKRKLAN
jgi:DNA polymerase-3 subunit delta'